MVVHVVLLLVCAAATYLACEWFVNAIEWLGARMRIGSVAVGSVLAAVGTALPESVVTLVAVLFGGDEAGDHIAVGAALGGPLVVGTIAYGVTGAMLLARHNSKTRPLAVARGRGDGSQTPADHTTAGGASPSDFSEVDTARMATDQTWFIAIFVVKVGLGLVAFAFKPWLGLLFFAAYGVYFWREMRDDADAASHEGLEPLKLQPRRESPTTWAVLTQTLVTLVIIFVASQLFVRQLEWAGPVLGLSAVVVALLLAPVATELPEILNAIIWVRHGNTRLALANISGSMMIQATVPSGIGLLGTPWMFDTPLLLAGIATLASVIYLLVMFRRGTITAARLTMAAGFYAAFAIALFTTLT